MNALDRPIPKPKGQCCCDPCQVKPGCEAAEVAGENPEQGFFGVCCQCVPRFACMALEDYDGSCVNDSLLDFVTVEYSQERNAYMATFVLPNRPPVDIAIGFEHGPGENINNDQTICYVVLSSECMNYRRQGEFGQGPDMEDTRLFQRLYDTEYDEPNRREVCENLDIEFEVDLGRCTLDGYEGEPCMATVRLFPAEWLSRQPRFSGFWDGDERCMFRRICITYEKDGERIDNYACFDDEYTYWETTFDIDGEPLTVFINLDSISPPIVSMNTSDGQIGYPVQVDCPDFSARWELDYGASIRIKGDQTSDCVDCLCFPKNLCVEITNSLANWVYRGTLTYDEYTGNYTGTMFDESPEEEPSQELTLSLYCDECTGQTFMQWSYGGEDNRVGIDCPLPVGSFTVQEENTSSTVLTFQPQGCADCFSATLVPCSGCPGGIPRTLYATFVPVDEPQVQTCLEGVTVALYWVSGVGSAGAFWSGIFRCPDCNNCSDESVCEVNLLLNCPGADEYGEPRFNLQIGTGGGDNFSLPGASCDPFYAEFGLFVNIPQGGNTCTDVGIWGADDPDPTYKIVITA